MTESYEVRSNSSSPLSADGARTHTDADPVDRILAHGGVRRCCYIPHDNRQDHIIRYDCSRDDIPHRDTGESEAEIIIKNSPEYSGEFFMII